MVSLQGEELGREEMKPVRIQNFITCLKATRKKNDSFYLLYRTFPITKQHGKPEAWYFTLFPDTKKSA
jgi:hypothetical protein